MVPASSHQIHARVSRTETPKRGAPAASTKSSGVFKMLGNGRTLPIFEQERIAVEFLSANREALKALATYPGVTTFILGLEYHITVDEGMIGFCVCPLAQLMAHALEIGIEPIYYVTLDRRHEDSEQDPAPAAAPLP